MLKEKRITFRLTENEYNNIIAKSELSNMTPSKYICSCINNKPIVVIEDLKDFRLELRRIGVNLNQIAALCNSGKIVCPSLEETQKGLADIWQSLNLLRTHPKQK